MAAASTDVLPAKARAASSRIRPPSSGDGFAQLQPRENASSMFGVSRSIKANCSRRTLGDHQEVTPGDRTTAGTRERPGRCGPTGPRHQFHQIAEVDHRLGSGGLGTERLAALCHIPKPHMPATIRRTAGGPYRAGRIGRGQFPHRRRLARADGPTRSTLRGAVPHRQSASRSTASSRRKTSTPRAFDRSVATSSRADCGETACRRWASCLGVGTSIVHCTGSIVDRLPPIQPGQFPQRRAGPGPHQGEPDLLGKSFAEDPPIARRRPQCPGPARSR